MDTLRLPVSDKTTVGLSTLEKLIADRHAAGEDVVVVVAGERETLSPQEAATHLGLSRQHVMRLIASGVLEANVMPGSRYRRIPLASVLRLAQEREAASTRADEHAAALDALGAPAE